MTTLIRVGLIDFDADVRHGRKMILESEKSLRVFFESNGADEDIDQLSSALIDVLLIDQRLTGGSGLNFYKKLRAIMGATNAPPAILSIPYDQPEMIFDALINGFRGTLSIESGAKALIETCKLAAKEQDLQNLSGLAQLVQRVKPEKQLDIHLNQAVASLPEKLSSNLRRLRTSWHKALDGKDGNYNLQSMAGVVAKLNFQSGSEAILRLHVTGNLDVP